VEMPLPDGPRHCSQSLADTVDTAVQHANATDRRQPGRFRHHLSS
jgi:hypothetical protein